MIYLFAGDDSHKKKVAKERFINSAEKNTEIINIGKKDFDEVLIESLYMGSGLFFKKSMVVFDNAFEKNDAKDFLLQKLNLMNESENVFVFVEGRLLKPVLEGFKKAGAKVEIFDLPKIHTEKFNNFLLANAFYAKDKLSLWIYFRQAMDLGVGMEELVGVLFWKIKDMILKKNFGKWKKPELQKIASKLSYLLPGARKEGRDAEAVFEVFILEAF